MILTSRGRYAVMALADMALTGAGKAAAIPLKSIASRQRIDVAFLEKIFADLKKASLVVSHRGPNGGYVLAKPVSEIKISEILCAVDENMQFTRCASQKEGGCMHDKSTCKTHHLWEKLEKTVSKFLNDFSLSDVCYSNNKFGEDEVR